MLEMSGANNQIHACRVEATYLLYSASNTEISPDCLLSLGYR